jgi:hypothetical protein
MEERQYTARVETSTVGISEPPGFQVDAGDPIVLLVVAGGTLALNYLVKPLFNLLVEALQRDATASVQFTELLNSSIARLERDKEAHEKLLEQYREERATFLAVLNRFADSAESTQAVLALHAEKLESLNHTIEQIIL